MDDPKQGGEEAHPQPEKSKSHFAEREEEVLEFWNKNNIFQKSLEKPASKGEFVFYDGPPFATGLPHYGHLLQSAIKDAIPRYRTMQGYRVERRWGWDCHGLPLENQIEQELKIKTKRDIEQYGVEKFNSAARNAVLRYADEWQKIIGRFGRWVDMKNSYRTMDAPYTESVWWAFKNLYDRGLVYEGFKAMHLCPRCGTTLSNFEVAQGYKDIDDLAVTVKLPLVDEPNTSLLVWTTTAWTLPGNTAAAVNENERYVKVKSGNEFFIVSKAYDLEGEVVEEFEGKKLIGKKYLPPFDYFKSEIHKHKTHAFVVYHAPYVTIGEGTGIVHLAPAYGAEDLALAQKKKIPLIHHVTEDGKFTATVSDFADLPVKPKGNPKETDVKIVENLKQRNLIFKEEKIKHSYPHCWRCETPLLNWAANSWFVNVQKIKNKLISQNLKVTWVPEHVGIGRFNNGLASAPDWAISRARFWGAPIPVWKHTKRKEIKVVGSIQEFLSMVRRSGNRYFVMRHGEAQHNVQNMLDPNGDPNNHLTEKGKREALHTATELKSENIDLIITSPFVRTLETAEIVKKEIGLPAQSVLIDERLHEYNEGKILDVRKRIGEFLFEVESRYSRKNILMITHGNPLWVMQRVAARLPSDTFSKELMLATGAAREISFIPFPHNENYELDLHRPYIDEVPMGNTIEGEWKRIPDVFDCWFESGSMPYASNHYPFEKEAFSPNRFFGFASKGYPADFIAESIDQTRGWFYSLIVLGVGLFGRSPYKAVVTNGLVLASDGRKMSKRLKNYPDPMRVVDRFGADALRYYLLSSSVIRGEDLRFNERGVDEVSKKLIMRLDNVRSFYQLYESKDASSKLASEKVLGSLDAQPDHFLQQVSTSREAAEHVLDRWILSRLNELVRDTTRGFEKYELDSATRPAADFIDDLSTWYIRRSRERFKADGEDKERALATLHMVLLTVARVMAPVMPFFAESLYQSVRSSTGPESVHLSEWPMAGEIDEILMSEMKQTRTLASKGLQMRERVGIKVRQPLALFEISMELRFELKEILADEVNVKEVRTSDKLSFLEDKLDTKLTPELKEEGILRNLIRRVQEWRKEQKLTIADKPVFELKVTEEEKNVAEKYYDTIKDETNLKELNISQTDA